MHPARPQQTASVNNRRDDAYEYKDAQALDEDRRPVRSRAQRGRLNDVGRGVYDVPAAESFKRGLRFKTALNQLIWENYLEDWTLLQHIAWLDHEFISEELLLELVGKDQDKLWTAIGNLERLSLVRVIYKGEVRGITINCEAQDQVVDYAISNPHISKELTQLLIGIVALLNNFLPEVTDKLDESWERARAYAPTVEALLAHSVNRGIPIPENKELALLNAKLGMLYEINFADAKKSLAYKERVLEINLVLYEDATPGIAKDLSAVGSAYYKLGDVKLALARFETSLAIYKSIHEENHSDIANTLDSIGTLYRALGDNEKALACFVEGLNMRQVLYLGNHPDVAASLSNLGVAYQALGDLGKGLDYKKRSLKMRQALYPSDNHSDIADSFDNVGSAYKALGATEKGLYYYERSLKMRQALYLADNHPAVATSLGNVGNAHQALGDVKKGLCYYERSLKMRQAIYLADNHPAVATSLGNIGSAHQALGDLIKGLYYYERSLKMRQALYPGNHPDVVVSLNNVGVVYQALGDVRKGLDYYELSLKMRQALYPSNNHPNIANSLNAVGLAYEALGDVRKGLDYQERSLKMWQDIHQESHPATVRFLKKLGLTYKNFGDIGKYNLYKKQVFSYNRFVNKRGLITEDIISIKQKLQKKVLNKIQALSAKGIWNNKVLGFDWGVLGYLNEDYLKNKLGELNTAQNVKIALSLCFEAINIGIANSERQNYICAIEFAMSYSELVSEIVRGHPEYFALKNIARTCLGAAEYRLVVAPVALNAESKEEFKGDGTMAYTSKSYYEYYNTALDKLLKLRLEIVAPQVKRLDSWYLGEDLASVAGLVYKVSDEFSNRVKLVVAPANLQNTHWLGLLFRKSGDAVDVVYMDSEQRALSPKLKAGLENGLLMNGYESQILTKRLEKQRYNNCGPEVIENFVYYLTGTRATQEGALWLHSLLVENSLLDPEEYGSRLEENNKLLGFLSNAEPISIRSLDVFPKSKTTSQPTLFLLRSSNNDARLQDDAVALNLLPAIEQFNSLWIKWVQNKMQQVNSVIYKTTLYFKGLDLAVDSARLMYEPGLDNAKKVVLDTAYLYGMYSGVNSYSTFVSGAEVVHQLHLGEYQKACNVAVGTASAMALPIILAHVNRPYLGFIYSLFAAASTFSNALENTYSFALELAEESQSQRTGRVLNNEIQEVQQYQLELQVDSTALAGDLQNTTSII